MTVILLQLRRYKLWLVLMLLCLFIQLFNLDPYTRFDRQLIEQWQLWRVLTGHLTHLTWGHFILNMAGMLMVGLFFAHYRSEKYWLIGIVFISMLCSAGLWLDEELARYVGFSGVLHGLFVMGGRWEMKRYKVSGAVILILITAKLIWEQVFGALPGSESMAGGTVAINAHLYGAVGGLVYVLISENGFINKKMKR